MGAGGEVRRPVVLQSFAEPGPTTNPHMSLLLRTLRRHVDVRTFDWRTALTGDYDVLHVHWPEVVVTKRTPLRTAAALVGFALVLCRCRLTRRAVVRTLHNLAPHERQPAPTRAVLRLCDRSTTWWVRLNDATPVPAADRATTVPLGDYGDWYAGHPVPPQQQGRLLSFGLVRPYKGVLELVAAFAGTAPEPLDLHVAGRPSTPQFAAEVTAAAAPDPRVTVTLGHLDDATLAAEIAAAQLVVLPYRAMHNSGAVLLALTLGRPALVPRNEVTDALAAEVGEWWVRRFDGDLTSDVLLEHARAVRAGAPAPADLSARSWDALALRHLDVYRAAVRAARG